MNVVVLGQEELAERIGRTGSTLGEDGAGARTWLTPRVAVLYTKDTLAHTP